MTKILKALVAMLALLTLTACSSGNETKDDASDSDKPKVAILLNGNLGDKSFFDSANNGGQLLKNDLGLDVKVVEMGFDNSIWETTLYETSDEDYDIIIVGTYQMQEILEKVAPEYPDKKYIIFDSAVSYDKGDFDNVYSILFKQNEGGYLAGALASMVAQDDTMPLSNGENKIGVVAGMSIPVLNDFITGYIEGAREISDETKVAVSYIGDFNDTAKAKDLTKAQSNLGVSVAFQVAAQAGLGVIEASAENQHYAIGVDADQAVALEKNQPDQAKVILSSVVKNIDLVIKDAVEKHMAGTLKYGSEESLGLKDDAIGLAENSYYEELVSEDKRKKISELAEKIKNGEIEVTSIFDMSDKEFADLKKTVAP